MNVLPFPERKAIGIVAEVEAIELIASMGGTAQALGPIPDQPGTAPRFMHPHALSDDGIAHSVSPDLICTLPDMPRGQAFQVQVKMKKPQTNVPGEKPFVYLDEKELHRMKKSARFFHVRFLIKLPDEQWLWLDVDDLDESRVTLRKRTVCGTKTFLIPVDLFRPMSEFTKVPINEPANTNAPPTAARA